MANTKSAEKRIRQNAIRRNRNRGYRSALRTEVKKLREALADGNQDEVKSLLPVVVRRLDSMASKGVIHRNAAARTKSRLTRACSATA